MEFFSKGFTLHLDHFVYGGCGGGGAHSNAEIMTFIINIHSHRNQDVETFDRMPECRLFVTIFNVIKMLIQCFFSYFPLKIERCAGVCMCVFLSLLTDGTVLNAGLLFE